MIELTGRRSATLSEQLDGMEKSGLISRCKNEQDKRNVDVELTKHGKKAAIGAMQNRQAYADELFAAMPQRKSNSSRDFWTACCIHGTFPSMRKNINITQKTKDRNRSDQV